MTRVAVVLLFVAGCSSPTDPLLATVPADASQAVVVRPVAGCRATLTAYDRTGTTWTPAVPTVPATVGRTGIIAADTKREGDGHTPAGVYPFGTAFGYAPSVPTGLPYRQATDADYWVDDAASPDYNRWVVGKPTVSAERMRRDDDAYSAGAVIEYNTSPVLPGRGSAIFFHVWAGADRPTAGCVAVSAENVARVLRWLDRTRNPVVVISAD